MIEKYYTGVDVQFLILVSSLLFFNVSRDLILSFVSYNLIRGNMFYRILGPLTRRLLKLTNLRRPYDELKVKTVIFKVALFR